MCAEYDIIARGVYRLFAHAHEYASVELVHILTYHKHIRT